MSRKRKNAGEGYGFMFSGAFTEKKDAEKKERQRKGSFIKGMPTAHGYRYVVMTPRDNPIRRKKKAKPVTNPMELAIMGANPARSITLRPGEHINITVAESGFRHNPIVNPSGDICGKMVQGYPCTREPGHRGPHLPQGATLRPSSRHNWGRRNPSAEEIREGFVGRAVDRVDTYREPMMPAGDYSLLGKGLALYVKPLTGGQVLIIDLTGVLIVSDETARQLWFVGGDQDVTADLEKFGAVHQGANLWELGEARRIDYKQRKEHVPNPDVDEWRHEFGEENGVRPTAYFDSKNKRLLLEGGNYRIESRGIVN